MNGQKEKSETKNFCGIGLASKLSGIGIQTLRKMADDQIIPCYKTASGQRMFSTSGLQKMCSINLPHEKQPENKKKNFLYTRVSTKKQLDDLSRQIEYIKRPEYAGYTLIQDVGSGINFKRKGLQEILDSCLQGTIGEVVVSHKDRLSRFAYDLLQIIITKAGGKITLLDNSENKSSEQELADDLLSIVHIFSCRQVGKRSYRQCTGIQNVKGESSLNECSEEII